MEGAEYKNGHKQFAWQETIIYDTVIWLKTILETKTSEIGPNGGVI